MNNDDYIKLWRIGLSGVCIDMEPSLAPPPQTSVSGSRLTRNENATTFTGFYDPDNEANNAFDENLYDGPDGFTDEQSQVGGKKKKKKKKRR